MSKIVEVSNLEIFYKKYSQEFINEFKTEETHFFVSNEVDHFVLYKNKDYPQTLFFGLINISDYNYDEFKDITLKLAKKLNCVEIVGPIDFSIWFSNRFKSLGFDYSYWWEPAGVDGIVSKFKSIGFQADKKYTSVIFKDLTHFLESFGPSYERIKNQGIEIKSFDSVYMANSEETIRATYELSIEAFKESHYYRPISYDQYKKYIFSKVLLFNNTVSCFAFVDNEIAGFAFCPLDKDHLGPLCVLKSIAVYPKFQKLGISSALSYEYAKRTMDLKILRGAGALIREGAKSEFLVKKIARPETDIIHEYEMLKLVIS